MGAGEADAGAVQGEPGQQLPGGDVEGDHGQDQEYAADVQEQPTANDVRRSEPADQEPADLGADDDEHPGRQHPEAILLRGKVLRVLQEHWQHEADAELTHR